MCTYGFLLECLSHALSLSLSLFPLILNIVFSGSQRSQRATRQSFGVRRNRSCGDVLPKAEESIPSVRFQSQRCEFSQVVLTIFFTTLSHLEQILFFSSMVDFSFSSSLLWSKISAGKGGSGHIRDSAWKESWLRSSFYSTGWPLDHFCLARQNKGFLFLMGVIAIQQYLALYAALSCFLWRCFQFWLCIQWQSIQASEI